MILETLQEGIGRRTPWRRARLTWRDAERFAMAVDPARRAPVPLSGDEEVETLPTLFCPDPIIMAQRLGLELPRPFDNETDGGTRWAWESSLATGDEVRMRAEITEIEVKQGSPTTGTMCLTTVMVECRRADGSLIGRCWGTHISYEGVPS